MRYNISFSIEKEGKLENKFEVIESDSKNTDYIAGVIKKKYPKHSVNIKYIHDSINGKGTSI